MYGVQGFGAMGPLYMCPDGATQVFNTADCPGGSPTQSSVGDQLSAISDYLYSGVQTSPLLTPQAAAYQNSFTGWLNQNAGTVAIVAVGLFLFAMVKR